MNQIYNQVSGHIVGYIGYMTNYMANYLIAVCLKHESNLNDRTCNRLLEARKAKSNDSRLRILGSCKYVNVPT